ncbi:MAG: S-methyl-5-thioribose-1-phosphate isomerase [Nitrospirota bacterium]|nr:S-methyl-5-thioribose-1-phosphate isomerase [Nitrospirota bacterium]
MVEVIEWKGDHVSMLDQRRLPVEVTYVECRNYLDVAYGIKELKVRGAPAIGIAAAMGVALGARDITTDNYDTFLQGIEDICAQLATTRPTAVNLFWGLERMKRVAAASRSLGVEKAKQVLYEESQRVKEEDIAINKAMGRYGARFVKDGYSILTHCNAGALATGGYGTALGVIRAAVDEGKKIKVYADETRPVLQGARLTAWELTEDNIDVTLITDNMAGYVMKKGMVHMAVVGADRITKRGDVANKIGTYSVAILCKEHGLPFYVAAPLSTIDFSLESGDDIPIEERDSEEITCVFGKAQIAPVDVKTFNPAFDVTPARYVTAIITEKGAFRPEDLYLLHDGTPEQIEAARIKD